MPDLKLLRAGEYLFHDGEKSESMYLVKSGKLTVVKQANNNTELVLSEKGPGSLIGEMGFFDNKSRSASAKAIQDSQVIVLGYKALKIQFNQYPDWIKSIVRTMNDHLRLANLRIKSLEAKLSPSDQFTPEILLQSLGILDLISRSHISSNQNSLSLDVVTRYTEKIFSEPVNRMERLLRILERQQIIKLDPNGNYFEVKSPLVFSEIIEWCLDWFERPEDQQQLVLAGRLTLLRVILEQGQETGKLPESVKSEDFHWLLRLKILLEKGLDREKMYASIDLDLLRKLVSYWPIINELLS